MREHYALRHGRDHDLNRKRAILRASTRHPKIARLSETQEDHMNAGGLLGLLIFIIVVFAIAWLIIWAVQQFLPELYPPVRIIVGVVALIAILIRVAAYFGIAVAAVS
jgi:hypothetical protein